MLSYSNAEFGEELELLIRTSLLILILYIEV